MANFPRESRRPVRSRNRRKISHVLPAKLSSDLSETLRDHFFRTNQFTSPPKAPLYPHHDASVFFREVRRLKADHAMIRAVHPFRGLNLSDLEAVQDFDERMDGVLEIVAPLRNVSALSLLLRGAPQLLTQAVQVVVKIKRIVDERLLERFVQKIIAILQ